MFLLRPLLIFSAAWLLVFATCIIRAEAADTESIYNPRHSYEFGAYGATFLPYHILGVTEIVPGWGFLAAVPTSKGVFELATFLGRGNGIDYDSVAVDYRYDIPFDTLEMHAFAGVNADTYASDRFTETFVGGWHFGGGVSMQLGGPVFLRSDFRYRLGPGLSLLVNVGLDIRLPADSSAN
jgi:hypothetical protein